MGIHTTTAGKVKVSFALDPHAYTTLRQLAAGPRGLGALLDELIRAEAEKRQRTAAPPVPDARPAPQAVAHHEMPASAPAASRVGAPETLELSPEASQSRDSGIAAAGAIPWGTHFCLFYQTKQDLIDILVPYFRAGLEANEFCLWVTSAPLPVEEARQALSQAVPDLERYLERGQIEILDYSQWYTVGGAFDANRVLAGWVEKEQQALAKGFAGLRRTGNTAWLEATHWRGFTDYEHAVDQVVGEHRMLAMCTYSLEKCGVPEILDVLANHEFALFKRMGQWEAVENGERKHATAERALAQRNERLQVLHEIDRSILAARSPAETAQGAVQRLQPLLGCQRVGVVLFDEVAQQAYNVALETQGETRVPASQRGPLAAYRAAMARAAGGARPLTELLAIPDMAPIGRALIEDGLSHYAYVPLRRGDQPMGALNLLADGEHLLGPEALAVAGQVADSLAVALHQARLRESEQQARQTLGTLQAANSALSQSLDLETVLERLLDHLGQLIPFDGANVSLRTGGSTVAVRANTASSGGPIPPSSAASPSTSTEAADPGGLPQPGQRSDPRHGLLPRLGAPVRRRARPELAGGAAGGGRADLGLLFGR